MKKYIVVYEDAEGMEKKFKIEADSPADASDAFYAHFEGEGCEEIRIYEVED